MKMLLESTHLSRAGGIALWVNLHLLVGLQMKTTVSSSRNDPPHCKEGSPGVRIIECSVLKYELCILIGSLELLSEES